ncbi:hypothetical protein Tco_0285178 [Tanacetum coccineum]
MVGEEGGGVAANHGEARRDATITVEVAPRHYTLCSKGHLILRTHFKRKYPNDMDVVHAASKGLDLALHWWGVEAAPLMSPRQDDTSEPLLYAGWMVGPYRCKDATWGQNNDPVTSRIGATSDLGTPK